MAERHRNRLNTHCDIYAESHWEFRYSYRRHTLRYSSWRGQHDRRLTELHGSVALPQSSLGFDLHRADSL